MGRGSAPTRRAFSCAAEHAEIKTLVDGGLDPDVEALVTKTAFKNAERERRRRIDAGLLVDTTAIDEAAAALDAMAVDDVVDS